ncbi:cell division protein FtsZ [Candidatus Nomurabacteria bacterium RIFCSPHIGHO2_01_FULL_39_220]|uniref:Cell division protein FtsZ n=1 Tax=Candidatus Nomurabacteria bacterium RIFCSPLOWO2_02_FULL_40_67 TaxID=1801787 RepID=A0A1F6Y3B8_9BACT|nr:MAG: Cell division protein ftsZ [Parcubacteria group bacterium GW2011_GWA2_40_37]KKS70633.1 MAG: Cell division protein ftsZ [Parcubacteria group bacterium GW2011_GWF2_42_7]OGI62494.1 MAG: cell division protein FtsZ [Candidatus Nomurabacteria bacterium RBG_16_40_11]OGI69458.1 MAG: cell division protein FtsZ [Candidatus Nomurabacteria bacterium RIFCSPHIGHO2_01_FULL_39_220]OGI72783.1 MAG: cell division protein FtsZ [Candidatus Nomurabacteria bacterium RIFCSPHIGHO2_02_41_18]OGI78362.1 MAG: cell
MPKINQEIQSFARIMVIGVGGSGKNAINHMINSKVKGVSFICMNTDTQDLHHSLAEKKIHIGKNLTKGLGAGMDPEVGKKAAEETKSEIQDVIKGADMIFIACGMGGGTGTGAAPIVARAAKEQGILTVAVTTKPFFFEGNHRMKIAEKGIEELSKEVDAIIVIPNDKLLQLSDKNTNFKDAFASADNVLRQAVEGISDLITTPGIINVDFADIKAVMRDAGSALMGIGIASGENRAEKAAVAAINSPLLEVSIHGAKGVLFAISGGDDLTIHEIQEAAKIITESIDKDAKVIFGTIRDEKLKKGELKVTVIATNFPADMPKKSLFSGSGASGQTLLKEDNANQAKKEISNSISNAKASNMNTSMNNSDFMKKTDKKPDTLKEIIIEDDTDDWSAVPAFLRRKK